MFKVISTEVGEKPSQFTDGTSLIMLRKEKNKTLNGFDRHQ